MNYDCKRPSSRVIRPPGGGSSNIFGVPEPSTQAAPNKSRNPNYQSNVFSANGNDDQTKKNSQESGKVKTKPASNKASGTYASSIFRKDPAVVPKPGSATFKSTVFSNASIEQQSRPETARKISNIPMFDHVSPRPATAPTQSSNPTSKSTVFRYAEYLTEPNQVPGQKNPKKAGFKPANPTMLSNVFCQQPDQLVKKPSRKNQVRNNTTSTVFSPPDKPLKPKQPASRNFTSNWSGQPCKMRPYKISNYRPETLKGSSCEIDKGQNHTAPILSSDIQAAIMSSKQRSKTKIDQSKENNVLLGGRSPCLVNWKPKQLKSATYSSTCLNDTSHVKPLLFSCDQNSSGMRVNDQNQHKDIHSNSQVFSREPTNDSPIWSSGFNPSQLK